MKIKISENIRRLRKEKGMTQEELAEVLGVTVGAASKWELGTSVPELPMIIGLANFFEISVDLLLDYELHNCTVAEAVREINALCDTKNYDKWQETAD